MDDKAVEIELFEAIQTALASVTEVKTVEAFNYQIDNEDKERPRKYPFVGVQIDTEWQNEEGQAAGYDQNQQKGDTVVIVHFIYEQIATETNQWLTQRAIVHKVFRALNGLTGTRFTPLIRNNTPHEESHGRVSDIQIVFNTSVLEYAYNDDDKPELAVGEFSIETQNDLIIENDPIRTGTLDGDVVDPVTGEITFSRVSGSGELTITDDSSGNIIIGKEADKNIKVNIVFERGGSSYSQTLDIAGTDLAEGEINPYIAGNEDLGLDWSVSVVDGLVKLAYVLSATGTDGTLYYVYNKIL